MGVKVEELHPITIGEGSKKVVMFVDPNCTWCHKLIEEVRADKELLKSYKFQILVVPALGEDSARKSKLMYCSTEKDPNKFLDAFLKQQISQLPQSADQKSCNMESFDKRLVFAEALGVKSVPFILNWAGRFTKGKPQNLKAWIELGEKQNEAQAKVWQNAVKQAGQKITQAAIAKKSESESENVANPSGQQNTK